MIRAQDGTGGASGLRPSRRGDAAFVLTNIGRTFGVHHAVRDVDLTIEAGEIHALVGENGAGKSTLGKILSGSLSQTSGSLSIDGRDVTFRRPADALHHGIATMHQEISLAPDMSVIDNVTLGREGRRFGLNDRRSNLRRFEELADLTGFDLDPNAVAGSLTLAAQQEVEVLRALARDARLIIMDEPTAALPGVAAEKLHGVVRALRERGTSVVYISHFLEEVVDLSDRITVLRNGRLVTTEQSADVTVDGLVRHMLGRDLESNFPNLPPLPTDAPIVLDVRGARSQQHSAMIDLTVRAGEVVGIFGLVGSGRSELAMTIFGANPHGDLEAASIDGVPFDPKSPQQAMRAGLMLLPESRKEQGLFLGLGQGHNVSIATTGTASKFGFMMPKRERALVTETLQAMGVDPVAPKQAVGALSGGNQQKVLFAKCLVRNPKVLVLDEPTRGVDVGSRRAIYDHIAATVADGMALIVISSDIDEVVNLSHRVLVLRDGAVAAELAAADATHDAILSAAFGLNPMGPTTEMIETAQEDSS